MQDRNSRQRRLGFYFLCSLEGDSAENQGVEWPNAQRHTRIAKKLRECMCQCPEIHGNIQLVDVPLNEERS